MAVENILAHARMGELHWLTSTAIQAEVLRNPDLITRSDTLLLLEQANEVLNATPAVLLRARLLTGTGFGQFDALHLAFAEAGGATALITTDDRFLRACNRLQQPPPVSPVHAINPVNFLQRWRTWQN